MASITKTAAWIIPWKNPTRCLGSWDHSKGQHIDNTGDNPSAKDVPEETEGMGEYLSYLANHIEGNRMK